MSNFNDFKEAVHKQFQSMAAHTLFKTDVSKYKLRETYLASFRPGDNPIFRERTEHDCQHCFQFIRAAGNIVIIKDNKLVSIWDVEIGGIYQPVADALAKLVKAKKIRDIFINDRPNLGMDFNMETIEDDGGEEDADEVKGEEVTIKWVHFFYELPNRFVNTSNNESEIANVRTNKQVLERGLKEITVEAAETVLELIAQNSVYRGEEFETTVAMFFLLKKEYDKIKTEKAKEYHCWTTAVKLGEASRIRNRAIGTLLVDISEGMDLDGAVHSFGAKMDGYKRPTALVITKKRADAAREIINKLGLEPALARRHAKPEDITINNVLFANRDAKKSMDVFDEMVNDAPVNAKKLKKVEEMSIDDFLKDILPKADSIELLLENNHAPDFMSLIAPVNADAKNMFKHGNNFSWDYAGGAADSMREMVKSLGGRVDGVFRFTHSWNELEPNQSLMDLHVFMPGNIHNTRRTSDSYGDGRRVGWNIRADRSSGGTQDVDYTDQAPQGHVPVENITFPSLSKMPEGNYICKIHNWSFRGSGGRGKAEIEFGGNIYQYEYPKTKDKEWITVAIVTLKNGVFTIEHKLPTTTSSKDIWSLPSQQFHKVSMIMNSPNHWDGEDTGNKHVFFILEGCKNPDRARGFFNEFLRNDLMEYRKVFEVLGSKMKVEDSDVQLSGLGFSSTKRNSVFCKVTGSFTRTIKINL